MQVFEHGRIIYLDDVGQSFVLFDGDSWKNVGSRIDSVSAQIGDLLGKPVGTRRTFLACGGDVASADTTTAYIADADGRILTWTILNSGYTPAQWSYLDGRQFLGCSNQ